MEFGDRSDNPFSIALSQTSRGKASGFKSAARLLALVFVGLTVTLAVTRLTPRWLVQRYTNEFESLSSDEKRQRLIQLSSLGDLAIEPIVASLADPDVAVGRTAYELLAERQNAWTVLPQQELQRSHAALVSSIQEIAVHLQDDRTGWATSLLQQTIQYSVTRDDKSAKLLYAEANHAIELLAISDRAGPRFPSDGPMDSRQPQRLTVRSEPLPVNELEAGVWTDWPPPPVAALPLVGGQGDKTMDDGGQAVDVELAETSLVYRSPSSKLMSVDPSQSIVLQEINPQGSTPNPVSTASFQAVAQQLESPLGNFDDRSVMHWLGSEDRELRIKARDELIARGFDEREIAIATQIVRGDLQTRLALLDAIAHAPEMDPRPWLFMFLDDESRDVKLQAVSVLATMNDPGVNDQLRMRVTDERDPTVAARIRRVLDLR